MNAAGTPTVNSVSGLAEKLISVMILLVVLAATAVVLRIISIYRLRREWKLHDAMSCLSLVCYITYKLYGSLSFRAHDADVYLLGSSA